MDTLIVLDVDTDATGIAMIEPVAKAEKVDLGHGSEAKAKIAGKTPVVVFKNDDRDLVEVPAGAYVNRGGKTIILPKYCIQKHEVTNAMFCEFLNGCPDAGEYYHGRMRIEKKDTDGKVTYSVEPGKENYPIVFVSYSGAEAYARWMSGTTGKKYSLPSEEQWEKAAGWDSEKKHLYAYGTQTDEIRPYEFAPPAESRNGSRDLREMECRRIASSEAVPPRRPIRPVTAPRAVHGYFRGYHLLHGDIPILIASWSPRSVA